MAKNFKNIVALKDATGQFDRIVDLKAKIEDVRKDFTMLSGNDDTQIGFNAMGGNGVISVVSNIAPQLCRNIQELTNDNNFKEALKFQNKLYQLSKAMFCETNPVPVKYALYKLGIFKSDECRLPLITLSQKSKDLVDKPCLFEVLFFFKLLALFKFLLPWYNLLRELTFSQSHSTI